MKRYTTYWRTPKNEELKPLLPNVSLSVLIPNMGACFYRDTWGTMLKNKLKHPALSVGTLHVS